MIKITGLDEVQKKLTDIQKNMQELNEVQRIPLSELFTDNFVIKHTQFSSLFDLFENSGFSVKSDEDLAAIPDDKWDEYIRSISVFDCWESMLSVAAKEWTARRLGF